MGPMWFIVICDLNDEIKSTLRNFVDDTKVCGELNTLEERATLHEDLDSLEEKGKKNLISSTRTSVKPYIWENLCSTVWNPSDWRAAV
ncbi:rna-directed dna polymerase from mobile element jockey-like [Pitangus sulphuratus]|nr:rna-directed dna polymerase from mobile element jockey-like [Pitangus sulphuratus]